MFETIVSAPVFCIANLNQGPVVEVSDTILRNSTVSQNTHHLVLFNNPYKTIPTVIVWTDPPSIISRLKGQLGFFIWDPR